MKIASLACAALAAMSIAQTASAAIFFTATNGSNLTASATFDIVGGKLQVVLNNSSAFDVLVPSNVLTALFFNLLGGASTLGVAGGSATSNGPTFMNGAQVNTAGTNVGGEWAYAGVSSVILGAGTNAGISSSGFSLFGNANLNGPNLSGPVAVDGLQYGITSTGDNLATDNGGLAGNEITKHSVIFLLNFAPGFSLAQISNVSFQYGTALGDPRNTCTVNCGGPPANEIPEPGSAALAGLALLAAASVRRRKQ